MEEGGGPLTHGNGAGSGRGTRPAIAVGGARAGRLLQGHGLPLPQRLLVHGAALGHADDLGEEVRLQHVREVEPLGEVSGDHRLSHARRAADQDNQRNLAVVEGSDHAEALDVLLAESLRLQEGEDLPLELLLRDVQPVLVHELLLQLEHDLRRLLLRHSGGGEHPREKKSRENVVVLLGAPQSDPLVVGDVFLGEPDADLDVIVLGPALRAPLAREILLRVPEPVLVGVHPGTCTAARPRGETVREAGDPGLPLNHTAARSSGGESVVPGTLNRPGGRLLHRPAPC